MNPDPPAAGAPAPLAPRRAALWLALICLVGFGLRFYGLGALPPGLYQDEAYNGLDALGVLQGERPIYFPANNGREPLYIYLSSLSVAVLGRAPLAVRLPAAVVGAALIPATYALASALYGRRVGLWAAAIVAVTFWPVALSRVGLRAGLLPLVTALSLACAVRGLRSGGRGWPALGGALYGLSFYTYLASRFTPLALLGILIFWYSAHRPSFPKLGRIAAFFLPAGLVLLPLGLAGLAQPEILLGRVGQVSVLNPAINGGNLAGTLLDNTLRALGMFLWRGDEIARHNLPGRPVFDPALGLAFAAGVVIAARAALVRRSPAHALPLIWVAVMLLPTVLAEDTPHFLRAVGVLPFAALLPALALDALWQRSWAYRRAARVVAVAALIVGLGLTAWDYFGRYVRADETRYLFQSAAVELAETGSVYLEGGAEREVLLDRRLWDSFPTIRFLLPSSGRLRLFGPDDLGPAPASALVLVWPYEDLRAVAAALPMGGLVSVESGPLHRGDLEPAPYPLYAAYTVQPCAADACPSAPLAEFEGGLSLLAGSVRLSAQGLAVELTWRAVSAPGRAVQVAALAYGRDAAGQEVLLGQADGRLGTDLYPSEWWRAGETVRETRWFELDAVPRAPLLVRVGLYDPLSGTRYPRVDRAEEFLELSWEP